MRRLTLWKFAADVVGYIFSLSRCTRISRLAKERIDTENFPAQLSPSGAAMTAHGRSLGSVTSGASQVECSIVLQGRASPNVVGLNPCTSQPFGRTW